MYCSETGSAIRAVHYAYLEKITITTSWALFLVSAGPVEAKSSGDMLDLGRGGPTEMMLLGRVDSRRKELRSPGKQ